MPVQLAIRFSDADLDALDELVRAGVGPSRPEVIRIAISHLLAGEHHRQRVAADLAAYVRHPETPEELARALANAVAACEAEDWSDIYPAGGRA